MASKLKQMSLREYGHCVCGERLHAVSVAYGNVNIECFDCGTSRPASTREDTQIVDAAAEDYWERRWSS
jgi:hypothetical protein